jgi:two-component system, NarL family, sensor histidine kinase UhpB
MVFWLFSMGCFAQNRIAVDSLARAYRNATSDSARVRIQFWMADEFYNGNLDTAIFLNNQACALSQKIGNCVTCQLDCFRGRSFVQNRKYNLDLAITILDTAQVLAEKSKNWYLLARIQSQKGGAFNRKKDFKSALSWLQKAIDTYELHGCAENPFSIYFNTSSVLVNMGRQNESVIPLKKAFAAAEKFGQITNQLNCLESIITQLKSVEKHEESRPFAEKMLDLAQKTGNREKTIMAYYFLGGISNGLSDYPDAVRFLEKAMDLFGNSTDKYMKMTLISGLGLNYAWNGQPNKARPCLNEAIKIAEKTNDWMTLNNCYRGLGRAAETENNIPEAEFFYEKALKIADTSNSFQLQHSSQAALCEFYRKNQLWEKAFLMKARLTETHDSLLNRRHLDKLVALETSLKYEQEKIEQDNQFSKIEKERLLLQAEKSDANFLISNQTSELLRRQLMAENQSKNIFELEANSARQNLEIGTKNAYLIQKETENKAKNIEIDLNQAQLRNQRLMLFLAIGLGLAALATIFYAFKKFRRRDVLTVRSSLAQDLHDDLGSEMSSLSLSAFAAAKSGDVEKMAAELEKVSTQSAQMVEEMRDIVWTMNPENDSTAQLGARMRAFAARLFDENLVELKFDFSEKLEHLKIEPEARKQLYLIFKEAVNNIAKHADATQVFIKIGLENGQFLLEIKDNGRGFDPKQPNSTFGGNGLRNLQNRAKSLGGRLDIESKLGAGTLIRMRAALK